MKGDRDEGDRDGCRCCRRVAEDRGRGEEDRAIDGECEEKSGEAL